MKLTKSERGLIKAVVAGRVLDFGAPPTHFGEYGYALSTPRNRSRQIRAEVIRKVLRGQYLPLSGADPSGIRVRGAVICGRLDLNYLDASLRVELKDCLLTEGLTAESALLAALCLDGSTLHCGKSASTNEPLILDGTKISGDLSMTGVHLVNYAGPAMHADALHVHGGLFMNRVIDPDPSDGSFPTRQFTALGSGDKGAVRLAGVKVGIQANFNGAKIVNHDGPALVADGIGVEGDLFFNGGFKAEASSDKGSLRLPGAHIGGQLVLTSATLSNDKGAALDAEGITVAGDAFMREGFIAKGTGNNGAVSLTGANISGQLSFTGATLSNKSGPALVADKITVEGNLFLGKGFVAESTDPKGAIKLCQAHADQVRIDPSVLDVASPKLLWDVDGLTFSSYPTDTVKQWLYILEHQTPNYAAQPYQLLATNAKEAGHDNMARKVLIAHRKDQLRRGEPGWPDRLWGAITYVTVGFGYHPWKAALLMLAMTLALWATLSWLVPSALTSTSEIVGNSYGPACSPVDRLLVAVDLSVPLLSTGVEKVCEIARGTPSGNIVAGIIPVLQALSWGLSALFVAGFTSIIRRR